MIAGVLLGLVVWYGIFITLWVQGAKNRSAGMLFVGAFFSLFLIGLLIAVIQYTSWSNEQSVNYQTNMVMPPVNNHHNTTKEAKLKKAFVDGVITLEEYNKKLDELKKQKDH